MLADHKIKVRFDFTFFAVVALLVFIDTGGTAMLSLIACILHEGGHLLAMALCGVVPEKITFYGGGIAISKRMDSVSAAKRLIILSAGCSVNAVLALSTALLPQNNTMQIFSAVNLLICCFNALPIGYFDGAEILRTIFESIFQPRTAEIIKKTIGIIMCVLIVTALFIYCVICEQDVSISLGFVVLYLILAQFIG